MTFGSIFGRTFSPTFQPSSQAAAVAGGWWLSGGIAAANCIAAYQAKGAASYAASKVNLANPGTYDAIEGTAPSWSSAVGWTFTNASSTYLNTQYVPPNSPSGTWAVRYSDAAASAWYIFGVRTAGLSVIHGFRPDISNLANSGAFLGDATARLSGTMILSGTKAYFNGTDIGLTLNTGSGTPTGSVYIGCWNDRGSAAGYQNVKVLAFCRYDTVLTEPQLSALTTAMNAL